jgi:hypothetical protein
MGTIEIYDSYYDKTFYFKIYKVNKKSFTASWNTIGSDGFKSNTLPNKFGVNKKGILYKGSFLDDGKIFYQYADGVFSDIIKRVLLNSITDEA